MNLRSLFAVLAVTGIVATTLVGAEEEKDPLKDIKCPMSGKAVDAEKVVAYKDAKVFLCCGNCVKAFADKVKESDELAAKSNHQLVATKQFEQIKCPLSGGKLDKEKSTKVVGLDVTYCCEKCQGKVAEMKEKEAIDLIFSNKSFEKAFQMIKKDKDKEEKKTAA